MKAFNLIFGLVVLLIIVFGITFFWMYVPGQRKQAAPRATMPTSGEGGPIAQLEFDRTRYPSETAFNELPLQSEFGKGGHYDFWFRNPNDKEVRLGLNEKSCVCTEVQIFLLDDKEVTRLAPLSFFPSQRPPALGVGNSFNTLANARAAELGHLEKTLRPQDDQGSVTIGPGRVGFLRLVWDGRRGSETEASMQKTLRASVWYSSRTSGAESKFQIIGTWLVEPFVFDSRDQEATQMSPDDASRELVYRCWTATRHDLRIECDKRNDPFLECEVKPFSRSDEAAIRSDKIMPLIREGQTIRVKVRPRSTDGTKLLDLGPFRRKVYATVWAYNEETGQEEEVGRELLVVQGRIKGDVSVSVPNQVATEKFDFGSFPSKTGKLLTATVGSDRPNLSLAVVEKDLPAFVEAKLEKKTEMDKTYWLLHVRILPGFPGDFPRKDVEPVPCEVVLRINSPREPERFLRIPLRGTATQ